jgi:hypothetical protein
MTASPQFTDALVLFARGVQDVLTSAHTRYKFPGEPPQVSYELGRSRAVVYSTNNKGARTELSWVDFETGKVMLPNDKKRVSRGNIFNPDRGLKNIASDGRPAFVR